MQNAVFDPRPGAAVQLAPGLCRVLAPNPSPMTANGTNTYLLGTRDVTVIDPGPASETHLQAILAAVPPAGRIAQIVVTHSHTDHCGLARRVARATGAPIMAFGPTGAGRSAAMQRHAPRLPACTDSADPTFAPDVMLHDGQIFDAADDAMTAIWTPGHMGNHLCLAWRDVVFTGDHVMGWSTSLIAPPEGDMADYRASLARMAGRTDRGYFPGHGPPVHDCATRIAALMTHRTARADALLARLAIGPADAAALSAAVYADTPALLRPAAACNIVAHMIDLMEQFRVVAGPGKLMSATFRLR